MTSTALHESAESLSQTTLEMHRAIASLIEELEAVNWYAQRVDASKDPALREILAHNRDEEKKHACMVLEWIRRQDAEFDSYLRRFLFISGSIVEAEHDLEHGAPASLPDRTLGIGGLRRTEAAT